MAGPERPDVDLAGDTPEITKNVRDSGKKRPRFKLTADTVSNLSGRLNKRALYLHCVCFVLMILLSQLY
jgi:hypothetical protein